MHPGFLPWWHRRHRRHGCGPSYAYAGIAEEVAEAAERVAERFETPRREGRETAGFDEGGAFGVRRPLRFLAFKLGLDEAQTAELAAILDELKTERAQASVDHRRSVSAFADAVSSAAFDGGKAAEAGKLRVASAERLRTAVEQALARIHALLNEEQRKSFAYLLRTGVLSL